MDVTRGLHLVRLDDAALLYLVGPLHLGLAPALHAAVEELVISGVRELVVDLEHVPELDDGGIAVLSAAAALTSAMGAPLQLRLGGGLGATVHGPVDIRALLGRAYPEAG